LREARRPRECVVEILGHGCEAANRDNADREDIAIPGIELELAAGVLQHQHQRIAVESQHGLAEGLADEVASKRRERRKRPRVCRLGKHLLRVGRLCFHRVVRLGEVINHRVVQQPIERPAADCLRNASGLIGHDDDADILVERHADMHPKARGDAVMPNDAAVRRLRNQPAVGVEHPVTRFVPKVPSGGRLRRDARSTRDRKIFGRDNAAPLERSVR